MVLETVRNARTQSARPRFDRVQVLMLDPASRDGVDDAVARARASGTPTLVIDLVVPGFVDIHTHGRGGTAPDMADCWLDPAATTRVLPAMATTSVLASVVFCCGDIDGKLERAGPIYTALSTAIGRTGDGAVIEGVHAEGHVHPWFQRFFQ